MTSETPSPPPEHGDMPEEQPAPQDDVERQEPRLKPESEMVEGKNYPHELPENRGRYDPATVRAPQQGQGQGG